MSSRGKFLVQLAKKEFSLQPSLLSAPTTCKENGANQSLQKEQTSDDNNLELTDITSIEALNIYTEDNQYLGSLPTVTDLVPVELCNDIENLPSFSQSLEANDSHLATQFIPITESCSIIENGLPVIINSTYSNEEAPMPDLNSSIQSKKNEEICDDDADPDDPDYVPDSDDVDEVIQNNAHCKFS